MITAKTELREVLHRVYRYKFFREQYKRKNVNNFILKTFFILKTL